MCYEVKCSTCGKTTWGGCGRHVPSVYNRLPETQRCNCKEWPGVNAPQPSTSCTILLSFLLFFTKQDNEYPIGVQPTPEFVLTTRDITRTGARSTLLVFNNEVGTWTLFVVSLGIYGANKILPSTTIVLPLKPEKVEATKAQLSEPYPEILLFLCKIKRALSSFPETQIFEFLPAQAFSIPELNNPKESIKIMVQKTRIIPCEMFSRTKLFCKPDSVIRIHGGFQDLLNKTKEFCMKIVN
ncbi:hypothetical protein PVK06_001630 [Gossypium arboreum]|uniref:Uncharacterized protein n=11 Tax=Gossypium TaxID=3633 RepID=A0ABR0R1P4_GOSAR|nr:hypothetical protein PVK06_001630 [Gossypium arboreum]